MIRTCFILILFSVTGALYSQGWTSWTNLQSENNSTIQYCYRLFPTSSGNGFSFKIKNGSSSSLCGKFDVSLLMTDGLKEFDYEFNNLKPGTERSCPGLYQFSGVISFSSIGTVTISGCDEKAESNKAPANFMIEYHNEINKTGKFKFDDPKGVYSFEATALSGHLKAANDPQTQQFKKSPDEETKHGKPMKGYGAIPSGTWYITKVENAAIFKLRLTPSADVVNPNHRDGFLIHGFETTPEDASTGCIILDRIYREKLMKAFLRDGKIKLNIQNKIY
jgi:hypothetical protein